MKYLTFFVLILPFIVFSQTISKENTKTLHQILKDLCVAIPKNQTTVAAEGHVFKAKGQIWNQVVLLSYEEQAAKWQMITGIAHDFPVISLNGNEDSMYYSFLRVQNETLTKGWSISAEASAKGLINRALFVKGETQFQIGVLAQNPKIHWLSYSPAAAYAFFLMKEDTAQNFQSVLLYSYSTHEFVMSFNFAQSPNELSYLMMKGLDNKWTEWLFSPKTGKITGIMQHDTIPGRLQKGFFDFSHDGMLDTHLKVSKTHKEMEIFTQKEGESLSNAAIISLKKGLTSQMKQFNDLYLPAKEVIDVLKPIGTQLPPIVNH